MKIKFPFVKHDEAHPKFEYNQIDDKIFIGTNMCCQTHFDKILIEKGIIADISLEKERMDHAEGVKVFLWLPTTDHDAPTPSQLQTGVDLIESLVKQGKKVYVHCKNGHGRAPTLVSAYYISQGLSIEEAIKKIQDKRPTIHLEENQVEALRKFSKGY